MKKHQTALIRALEYSVKTAKENGDYHSKRAESLSAAIENQNSRIGILVSQNGELEDRNALLERVCRANNYLVILAMPTLDGPRVLERTNKISIN